jgi:hypothetical protein
MARDNPPVHMSPDEREKMIEEMSKEVRKETVQPAPKRRSVARTAGAKRSPTTAKKAPPKK